MKRIGALGVALLAALTALSAASGPLSAGTKAKARPPLDYAVGRTVVQYDENGQTVTATIFYPAAGRATTLDVEDAPRATKWAPYPLILFSHDLGATPASYHELIHKWAEEGYVVAVPTYPSPATSSSDADRQQPIDIGERATDASFVISRMLDRVQGGFGQMVDRKRIAAVGHSLGAATTYLLAYGSQGHDERIAAVVTLGGGLAGDPSLYFGGVNTPLLAIHGDSDAVDPIDNTTEIYKLASPPKYFITLIGGSHSAPYEDPTNSALTVVEKTTTDFLQAYLDHDATAISRLRADGKVSGVTTFKGQTG
ncbi:MAG TPA: dienelactone hydrolase family protein [Acidimicrobiia bacterium]|jgi:predicted dienelactone hydrolase